MKFSKDDMLGIQNDDPREGFKIIVEGEWEVDAKYQYRSTVFEFNNNFYRLESARSGSPFSDYHYDSDFWKDDVECQEVEQKERVIKTWVKKAVQA